VTVPRGWRPTARVRAVQFEKVERVQECRGDVVATAQRVELARASGPATTASPSIVKLRAWSVATTAAMKRKRSVHVLALRVNRRTDAPPQRTINPQPSCLISWTQPEPPRGASRALPAEWAPGTRPGEFVSPAWPITCARARASRIG